MSLCVSSAHPHPQWGALAACAWVQLSEALSSLGLLCLPLAKTTTILVLLRRLADSDLTFLNYEVKNTQTVTEGAYFLSQKSAWRQHEVWLSSRVLLILGGPFLNSQLGESQQTSVAVRCASSFTAAFGPQTSFTSFTAALLLGVSKLGGVGAPYLGLMIVHPLWVLAHSSYALLFQ